MLSFLGGHRRRRPVGVLHPDAPRVHPVRRPVAAGRADARPARSSTFAFTVTLVTGIVFGLLPALRASRPDPWKTLKDTVGSIAGGNQSLFLRKGLVTAQVALSFLLLFGAGLFTRSLQNLRGTDTGVREPENLISFQVDPSLNGYDDARAHQLPEPAPRAHPGDSRRQRGRRVVGGHPRRRRMGQHDVGRGPQGGQRRGHAGVHERPDARLLQGHARPAARRPRLRDPRPADAVGRQPRLRAARRDREPPLRRALLQDRQRGGQARRLGRRSRHEAEHRDRRRRREPAVRRPARGRPPAGVRSRAPAAAASSTTCAARSGRATLYGQLRNEVRRIDNAMPVFADEDAGAAAGRDAAHRSPGRAARRPASACSPRRSRRSVSTA